MVAAVGRTAAREFWRTTCARQAGASPITQELAAIFRRRLAKYPLENPIKMGKRLETDLKSDLAHAQIRIEKQVF